MKTSKHSRILALILVSALNLSLTFSEPTTRKPDARSLASSLPPSDAVLFVDLQRIMMEIVPRLLANDPATLAKLMNAISEVKNKTGFNILGLDGAVAGLKFVGTVSHEMKKENIGIVVLIHGDFDANTLVAFLRQLSKGKLPEETYGGKVIYSEPLPAPPANKKERETAALTVLDNNTVALGDLPQVRATIDSFAGKGSVDPKLVQLAERDASSVIGMAGNVPQALLEDLQKSAPKNEPMAQELHKALMGVKQIFGSIGATPVDFNVISGLRMDSEGQAASVGDLLLGVRQHALSEIKDKTARGLIDSLQIVTQGDEVQIKCDIKNEVVQQFVASMMKEEKAAAKATPGKTKRTTRSRRARRRRAR